MKAAVLRRYGGNDAVEVREVREPDLAPDQLLVDTVAAGVLPVDVKLRRGAVRVLQPVRFPQVMGMEVAGTVARVGGTVTRFKVGDAVYARIDRHHIGSFAERCVVREVDAAHKPARLSFEEAVALPVAALTSHQALLGTAKLQRGQKVFINAGSGSTGTIAIQFAKAYGAWVSTTTSTPNVEWVRALGADEVLDYRRVSFERELRDFDVVIDLVGGPHISRGFDILKPGAHLLSLADAPDAAFARRFGLNPLVQLGCAWLSRRETKRAKQTGTHYTFFFVEPSGVQLAEVTRLVDEGKLKPVIDRVFPLEAVRDALAHVEAGRSRGKVVLRVKA